MLNRFFLVLFKREFKVADRKTNLLALSSDVKCLSTKSKNKIPFQMREETNNLEHRYVIIFIIQLNLF